MIPRSAHFAPALILAFAAGSAEADEQTLVSVKDNTLYESATGHLSNGVGHSMFAGRTGQAAGIDVRRGLVEFDIAGSVPAGSSIDDVTLMLYHTMSSSGPNDVELHLVLAEWGEGTSNAGAGEGAGAGATPGDATWLHTDFSSAFWANPGGDFAVAPSASTLVGAVNVYFSWSSPQMVAEVQTWLDDSAQNHGWMLTGDELAESSAKRFSTRNSSNPALRPSLIIEFTPPASPEAYCFGVGCPCNNDDPTAGCANGSFGQGARLIRAGTPSVANDSVVLVASSSTPNQPGVFFQGDDSLNGGDGIPFGDGLRCAGTNVVRLEVSSADGAGDVSSKISIAAAAGITAGDVRRYQWWYRDPAASPCGSGFNLSNAVELNWLP